MIVISNWLDTASPLEVETVKQMMTNVQVPILDRLAGGGGGSYTNEADVREPNFQTTFYGPNYARLSAIKGAVDPTDLFIVGGGVGSERWDVYGLCMI